MSSEQVIAEELREHAADLDRCAAILDASEYAEAFKSTAAELRLAASENRDRADRLSTPAAGGDDGHAEEIAKILASHGYHRAAANVRQLQARNAEHRGVAIKAAINSQDMVLRLSALLDGIDGLERDCRASAERLIAAAKNETPITRGMFLARAECYRSSADDLKALREKANG